MIGTYLEHGWMHLFMVQVGAWLIHLFMVHVDYKLRYRLMHDSYLLVDVYKGISHSVV